MAAIPVFSNICSLTKIKVFCYKVCNLVELENLFNSTLLLARKLISRSELIVRYIYMSVFILNMGKNIFISKY